MQCYDLFVEIGYPQCTKILLLNFIKSLTQSTPYDGKLSFEHNYCFHSAGSKKTGSHVSARDTCPVHVSSKWHANPNIWVLNRDAIMDLNTMEQVPSSYSFISASPTLQSGTSQFHLDFEVDLYIFVNPIHSTMILCKVWKSTSTFY